MTLFLKLFNRILINIFVAISLLYYFIIHKVFNKQNNNWYFSKNNIFIKLFYFYFPTILSFYFFFCLFSVIRSCYQNLFLMLKQIQILI